MKVEKLSVDSITIPDGRRPLVEATVVGLVDSMARLGQMQPIRVCGPNNQTVFLVAGRHRLEAARRLEWDEIDVVFVAGTAEQLEMQEIAENLHRADLTVLQRDQQIARWLELVGKKPFQPETVASGGRGKAGGINAAAGELGISKSDAHRAVKIAAIAPAAKAAAVAAGIDDNRAALTKVAAEPTAARQVAAVKKIAKAKATPRSMPPASPGRGPEAICYRVREAIRVLSGLPLPQEVQRYFAGTDAAILITETIAPARAWLDEFADGWVDGMEAAE